MGVRADAEISTTAQLQLDDDTSGVGQISETTIDQATIRTVQNTIVVHMRNALAGHVLG